MNAIYKPIRVGDCLQVAVEPLEDGSLLLRSTEPLQPCAARLTDRLEHRAAVAPGRTFVARRDPAVPGAGDWQRISYAQMLDRAQRIGQALVQRGLSADRPIAILSDNDL